MKKLFTNDNFFLTAMIVAAMCESIYAIFGLLGVYGSALGYVQLLMESICIIVLFLSYKKHMKNVMKGMMGVLLMAQVSTSLSFFTVGQSPLNTAVSVVFALLSVLLLITHFLINGDRKANPTMVLMNQIIVILLALTNILRCLPYCVDEVSSVMNVIGILGCFGITAVIVCMESRLDMYRSDREAAGWTEESGYPQGYVHQYEKDREKEAASNE